MRSIREQSKGEAKNPPPSPSETVRAEDWLRGVCFRGTTAVSGQRGQARWICTVERRSLNHSHPGAATVPMNADRNAKRLRQPFRCEDLLFRARGKDAAGLK
jgi:hypothetical protein